MFVYLRVRSTLIFVVSNKSRSIGENTHEHVFTLALRVNTFDDLALKKNERRKGEREKGEGKKEPRFHPLGKTHKKRFHRNQRLQYHKAFQEMLPNKRHCLTQNQKIQRNLGSNYQCRIGKDHPSNIGADRLYRPNLKPNII